MKDKKEYSMVQLDKEFHKELKEFCKLHGYQLKGFVQTVVKKAMKNGK